MLFRSLSRAGRSARKPMRSFCERRISLEIMRALSFLEVLNNSYILLPSHGIRMSKHSRFGHRLRYRRALSTAGREILTKVTWVSMALDRFMQARMAGRLITDWALDKSRCIHSLCMEASNRSHRLETRRTALVAY